MKINDKFLNLEAISEDMEMEAVCTSPPYNQLQCLQFVFWQSKLGVTNSYQPWTMEFKSDVSQIICNHELQNALM